MNVMMTDFREIVDKSPMQPNQRDFKGEITRIPMIFWEYEGKMKNVLWRRYWNNRMKKRLTLIFR